MKMPGRSLTGVVAVVLPTLALAQAPAVQPGQWEVAVRIDSVDMPGAPPMVAGMMRGRKTTMRYCLTPEQASRGPQDMMKANKSCTFTRYSVAGGRLSSEMVCRQGGATTTATSVGSFTPTSFAATGRAVTTGGAPMTVTTSSTGRRLGDCR